LALKPANSALPLNVVNQLLLSLLLPLLLLLMLLLSLLMRLLRLPLNGRLCVHAKSLVYYRSNIYLFVGHYVLRLNFESGRIGIGFKIQDVHTAVTGVVQPVDVFKFQVFYSED
jgi:hypothetical protein